MPATRSERIIEALRELEQFLPAQPAGPEAVNVLTGAVVMPVADDSGDAHGHGLLQVRFGAGTPFQVNGDMYLALQIVESARLGHDGDIDRKTPTSRRVEFMVESLYRKHDL